MSLDTSRFTLYYQPKINLLTKKVESCEALIRRKENGKIILPQDFLPQAVEDGTIVEIDKWVFKEVAKDARSIFTKTFGEEVSISFNISPLHFNEDDIYQNLMHIFTHTKDFNSRFEIEITEDALIANKEKSLMMITKLKEEGFKFALDDFGTGYASLSYLRDFPIDTLKIDKSFIDDMTTNTKTYSIVEAILNLSKKLNIKSVAEGIEDIDQANLLHTMQCDEIQGYYFSKPLPLEKFILFVLALNKSDEKENQFIHWSDSYTTHFAAIDSQHMIIVNLLNKLHSILKNKEAREKALLDDYLEVIDTFISTHFEMEYKYMHKYNYPKRNEHMLQHKSFTKLFEEFKTTLNSQTNERDIFNLFNLLKKWFLEHEIKSDREFTDFIKTHIQSSKNKTQ